jgi:hypothetical protein
MRAIVPLLAAALLAGCALDSGPTRLTGAETRSAGDSPRTVPAGFTTGRDGTRMELVAADGTALTGLLTTQQQPIIVPLAATGAPLVGGGTDLAGEISGGGVKMNCRFRLLNPPRGLDGGGSGRCEGSGRRVDFLF